MSIVIKTFADFTRCCAKPPAHPVRATITPDMATKIIALRNDRNRKPKEKKQLEYVADMKANQWALTGDTIKMSASGELRDGQNRIMACMKAGVNFETFIMFGIPDEFFDRMDIGKPRTVSDLLHVSGMTNVSTTGAITRWVHLFKTKRVRQRDTFSQREILRLVTQVYGGAEGVGNTVLHSQARQIYMRSNNLIAKSLVGAIIYLILEKSPDKARPFIEAWTTGDWSGRFEVLQKLKDAISEHKGAGRANDVIVAAYVVLAWNKYVKGGRAGPGVFDWVISRDEFPEIAQ